MHKLEQNELGNLWTQHAQEMGDLDRVQVGVKMYCRLKAREESPASESDLQLARRPTAAGQPDPITDESVRKTFL